jgi:hypothetical protein
MHRFIAFASAVLFVSSNSAQTVCSIQRQELFAPQGKIVALASQSGAPVDAEFVLFRSRLRVNTDGSPNSYHPDDLTGQTKAINNIANAISVRRNCKSVSYKETIQAFQNFRDHDWNVPAGYQIIWQNVLAARTEKTRKVPCVFQSGEYQGYFGSLTALKNNLSGTAAGECGVLNQLDERYVPALVIAGASNPLKDLGVSTGDLLIAINPGNGAIQAAVVGDVGPPDNLGEGSVALNMSLLKRTHQPTNYSEAKTLDTGPQEIIVAIIPKSGGYELKRPYSAENISSRVVDWLALHGYGSLQSFDTLARACASTINLIPNK